MGKKVGITVDEWRAALEAAESAHYTHWSPAAVNLLKEFYPRGVSVQELSRILDSGAHSVGSVRNKVTEKGLKRGKKEPSDD